MEAPAECDMEAITRTDGEFLLSYALQSWIARSERTYGSKPFEYYGGFPLF